jgi:hypothetical protein
MAPAFSAAPAGQEIEAPQEQLHALQHDHTVLVNTQQALGSAHPAAEAD